MSRNGAFIDLTSRDRDRHIYRFLRLKHLYDLFDSRKNFLPDPGTWEDPFEDLLGRSTSGPAIYAQCWSFHTASDALWRIYSPANRSVRIRSTVRALLASLEAQHPDSSFIGRVKYLPKQKLKEFALKNVVPPHRSDPRALATTLLVKRPAFNYEREVRLILVRESDSRKQTSNSYRYTVDPHALVDQIMLDPRMPPSEANKAKVALRKRIGFQGEILRSLLYTSPKELVAALQEAVDLGD